MALKQRLDQRQVQKLILAPALQQAIKLLPLTNLELIEIIDNELSQNPMLEEETPETKAAAAEGKETSGEERPEAAEPGSAEPEPQAESGAAEDLEFESRFQDYLDDGFRPHFSERRDAPSLENTLSKSPSLMDLLIVQANVTFTDKADKEAAQLIIGNIDGDGYLRATEEELSSQSGVPVERVHAIREQIKTFDPVGVGSLDVREALLAQMDYRGIEDELARRIVREHLDLVMRSDFAQLGKVLGIPVGEIKGHLEVIRKLDPAPGSKYSQEKTTYVVPDISVTKEDNEVIVGLVNDGLPRLRISGNYASLLAKASKDSAEAYNYLKDKRKKAEWFLRSLAQRDQTIFRVAKTIVDRQRDFFEKGMDFIKPLTLMEIAREIGVHESTVGRVVANKSMSTPWGVFSLKYFFHKSLTGDLGQEVSSLKVKEYLRKLVESEDRSRPLSDIEIGDALARNNLKIARRTVAKYRKQLKIPPSHIRKRKFVLEEAAS
jgi:RNA polymerase sigma-54 factor